MELLDVIEKLAPTILAALTVVVGYVKLGAKVDRLEEKFTDHKKFFDGECESREKSEAERNARHSEDLRHVEEEFGKRLTEMEARQFKLEETLYREVRNVASAVQEVQGTVKEISGYMRAQQDMEHKATARTRRR